MEGRLGGGGLGVLVCCLTYRSNFAVDHAPMSRRSTVSIPNTDTSNIWAFHMLFLPPAGGGEEGTPLHPHSDGTEHEEVFTDQAYIARSCTKREAP